MTKIACFILSYEITKGMKSFGPIGLLKSTALSRELVLHQIDNLNKIFHTPDIHIVSGFGGDKLHKKLPSNIKTIVNNEFNTKNQGHALKLVIDNYQLNKYSGLFLINSGTLIRSLAPNKTFATDKSWILSKNLKRSKQNIKFLGTRTNSGGQIDHIFYDTGDHMWCDSVYITNKDVGFIKAGINNYYDNMFLFEIINKSIINHNIKYDEIIVNNDAIVSISGMKDKHKIKE